jgi:hypothetical protein
MKRILVSLILASCSNTVKASTTPEPFTPSPMEHDAKADYSYRCICNSIDIGTCTTVFINDSEVSWYVLFKFQEVTIQKQLAECKPLIVVKKGKRK